MSETHQLLVLAFGDLSDDSWREEIAAAELRVRKRIASYDGQPRLDADVSKTNIGRGADWTVLAISFGMAAIAVPTLHKKVWENIEEWKRLYHELHAFFTWILEEKKALYPDNYLFVKAVEILSAQLFMEGMEFKGVSRIPEANPDLQGREALIFSFGDAKKIVQVAMSRSGDVLWQNSVSL